MLIAFSGLLIVFSDVYINAYAVDLPSGGRFLTANETLQFIGSEIPVTYFDGTNYQQTVATYDSSFSWSVTENTTDPVGFMSGRQTVWLDYTLPKGTFYNNASYTTFDLQPTYSLFDTQFVYTCFGMSYGSSSPSFTTYNSPQSDWYIGGTVHHFENNNESSTGSGSKAFLSGGTHHAIYVPISFSSQSTFSAYAMSATFFGNGGNSVTRHFYVMCPYISSSASGASGTFDTSSGGGSGGTGDINVNIDLEETNGILDSILDGISGIGDTLIHVFVPTDEQILDFKDDLNDLLDDTFSGIPETNDILDDVKDVIADSSPVSQITFPAVSVPNTHFSIPQKIVNLNPDSDLLDFIKMGFDILATCLFINLIRLKFDEIIHGKVVVESDETGVS